MTEPPASNPSPTVFDDLEQLAAAKVQLQLIEAACRDAIHYGHAFGSELRLAQRILAILDHRL